MSDREKLEKEKVVTVKYGVSHGIWHEAEVRIFRLDH
jgi:hypothetical protein